MTINFNLLFGIGFLLLLAILAAITTFFATRMWPLLKDWLIANGREREATLLQWVVETAVNYAEQVGEDNADKKSIALAFVQSELRHYGIDIDVERMDALIEAAVQQMLAHFLPDPEPILQLANDVK